MLFSTIAVLVLISSLNLTVLGQAPLDCSSKGSLGDRFRKNLQINDANNDGQVTGVEIYNDFSNNYDTDKDGCSSVSEWVKRWETAFQFSPEYARKRMANAGAHMNESCAILYSPYKTAPINIPDADFLSGNIQSLIDLCNADPSLAASNCDCAQLSNSCRFDQQLHGTDACKEYTATYIYGKACEGKGLLADRFEKNLDVNDADGDGFIAGAEIYNDFHDNYDVNNDSCVSVQEWVNRFTSYYGFSDGYARQRLSDIVPDMAASCTVKYDSYMSGDISIPRDPFLQGNIQSLVEFCKTASSDVRANNCDCLELLDTCKWHPLLGSNVVCQSYIKAPIV